MTQAIDVELGHRLDALEIRGRDRLARAGRHPALIAAAEWAVRAAIVPPLLAIPLALGGTASVPVLVFAAAAVPLIVLGGGYVAIRRRQTVERRTALGLFDRALNLKDRVATAEEFLCDPRRDGFREAALAEAAPWLDRALAAPVDIATASGDGGTRRLWPWIAAACALLAVALALTIQRTSPRGGRIASGPAAASRTQATAGTASSIAGSTPAARTAARSGASATGDGTRAATDAGDSAGRSGPAGANMTAPRAGEAAPSRPGPGAPGGASPASTDRAPAGSRGRPGRGGDADRGATPQTAAERTPPGGAETGGDAAARAGQAPVNRPEAARTPGASAQRGGTPPPPRAPAPDAAGTRPNAPRRPQPGQQGGQQSGQNNGRGRPGSTGSGQAAGTDALKRARGVSALLLAVPMEDRLIGTANAGRVASSLRAAAPQSSGAAPVAAQARGTQRGDVGQVPHRPATRHDDRLLGGYFRRPGMGTRP